MYELEHVEVSFTCPHCSERNKFEFVYAPPNRRTKKLPLMKTASYCKYCLKMITVEYFMGKHRKNKEYRLRVKSLTVNDVQHTNKRYVVNSN